MIEDSQILEFLNSLLESKEWTQNEIDVILELKSRVQRANTYGELKEALISGIKSIPYIIEWIEKITGS